MFQSLPNHGRVFFKNSAGTVITSAIGDYGPLTSDYKGFEVDAADIRNTWFFSVPGFSQRRLATKIVAQGHYVWIDTSIRFLITGLKDHGSHTELVGRQQALTQAFTPSTSAGLISEWAFKTSAVLLTDEKSLNTLTNVNTVTFDTDKSSLVMFDVGSALFVSASSQQLRITDASQVQLDVTGALTIALRVKFTTIGSVQGLVSKASSDPNLGFYVYLDSNNKIAFEVSSDGTVGTRNTAIGATLLSAGTWYSVCAVQDGTNAIVYLNGMQDTNGTDNPNTHAGGQFNNGQNFCLGSRSDSAQFLNGLLGHVFIFNQAKSAAAVLEWHNTDIWP